MSAHDAGCSRSEHPEPSNPTPSFPSYQGPQRAPSRTRRVARSTKSCSGQRCRELARLGGVPTPRLPAAAYAAAPVDRSSPKPFKARFRSMPVETRVGRKLTCCRRPRPDHVGNRRRRVHVVRRATASPDPARRRDALGPGVRLTLGPRPRFRPEKGQKIRILMAPRAPPPPA